MFQSVSAVKASADLSYLQRGDKIDRNPVAVVSDPGVKTALAIKSLAFRHLEAEFMAPVSTLSRNLLILYSERRTRTVKKESYFIQRARFCIYVFC